MWGRDSIVGIAYSLWAGWYDIRTPAGGNRFCFPQPPRPDFGLTHFFYNENGVALTTHSHMVPMWSMVEPCIYTLSLPPVVGCGLTFTLPASRDCTFHVAIAGLNRCIPYYYQPALPCVPRYYELTAVYLKVVSAESALIFHVSINCLCPWFHVSAASVCVFTAFHLTTRTAA
jgi:hypothetical protein